MSKFYEKVNLKSGKGTEVMMSRGDLPSKLHSLIISVPLSLATTGMVVLPSHLPTGSVFSSSYIHGAAHASDYGDAPKMEFFKKDPSTEASTGPVVYDEAEAAVIAEKKAQILERWKKMIMTVEKGIPKNNKDMIKTSIANNMNKLKTDMRRVSKVLSGGEILVRERDGAEAKFDYNSGQFALKPIAGKAEQVFADINEVYFYAVNLRDPAAVQGYVDTAKATFDSWYSMVK
eukprot:CAMPEP_0174960752 /NCGR_PEP_ID=MMETSP0004_2-20121128/3870_1 /TAXON_ID=420556 /ORGANISM="Ochromonas sp., Strain CCMP1393" /LENGTH=231 /DNA_ID=CAMNT_0016209143 /DNA_START=57 /DNA_END=752 /DNA_ORIENTATION=+